MSEPVCHLRLSNSARHIGGANRVIWSLATGLRVVGIEPILYFLVNAKPGQPTKARASGWHQDVEYHESVGRRFVDLGQLWALRGFLRERGVRIVHSHDSKADAYALLLKRLLPNLRIVSTVHGFIALSPKSKLYCWLDKRFLRFFDRIFVVSPAMRELFPEPFRARLEVLSNGLDTEYWKAAPRALRKLDGTTQVGFVGRISPEKGWREFVDVARKVSASGSEFRFRVAGDGPQLGEMRALTDSLGLSQRFEFLGAVEDMRAFYKSIDLLLAPSWTEGLPMAQMEACAMGLPVVVTDVGGVSGLVEHGQSGLLARAGDVETLAKHVLHLGRDPQAAFDMGLRGRRIVEERYSIHSRVAHLAGAYASLLDDSGSGARITDS
ncbi:glycosyltransferase [Desulfocurvibacter africanus PCS]|uniref:Glycosyltransferase n=1 Tax=Desulfocurvibacter africanus PCS TaxID=1262666 RepID=M5PUM3_DESAF|nr:glycosyltransferase [Desulfocurvibacter africanus]EMG37779.1 glycosyltransferase [Desulfocurvibacter africanus PCS]